jgi:exonuclease SbcC
MRLTRLVLKDFISYEDLDYMFESKPLLVQGINLTDDGQKTNGVGKSVIPTAIEQCIAGTNSRGVLDVDLIMYGKQQASCELYAECDIRKERIHIQNILNLKGSNQFVVKIQKYDSKVWEPANYSTSPEGKKFVSDWFGISKEDLFNYFIINNTRFKSFFASSNTEKVGLVNRFSDASIVQGIEDIDLTELEEQKASHTKLKDSVSGKIELIEGSIKTEEERDFKQELQEKIDEFDEEIEEIQGEIEVQKKKISNNNLKKPEIEKRIKELQDSKLSNSTKKVEIESEVEKINKEVTIALKLVEDAQKEFDNFKVIDFKSKKEVFEKEKSSENSQLEKLKLEKEEKSKLRTKVSELLESLSIKLSGVITCPNCSHKFLLDDDLDKLQSKEKEAKILKDSISKVVESKEASISEVQSKVTKIEESISKINTEQSKWNDDKNKLSISVNSNTEILNKIRAKLNEKGVELKTLELKESTRLSSIKSEQDKIINIDLENKSIQTVISVYEANISKIEEQKKQVTQGDNKEQLEKLKEDLSTQRKEFSKHQLNLSSVEEKIANQKQWILNFKQFRMYLANKSLGVIEYHCNRYLQEMGSDLIVKVDGFKVLSDSTVKEEITCRIIRNIERSFRSFSGGERGRLLFASILANRFMINETHPYGGLDFLSIDEVFEGVDSEGLISLIESAKLLSIPVLLITHVSVEEDDNVLTIVKENGVSKIKY